MSRSDKFRRIGHLVLYWMLKGLDAFGGLLIRTYPGALLVGFLVPKSRPVLCSECFTDQGLKLDARKVGIENAIACPNCGARSSKKLTSFLVESLAHRFFVRGSILRTRYGASPLIQFNELKYGHGDYRAPQWLQGDVRLVNEAAKIGLFNYGPRLWMLGEVEPLKDLERDYSRQVTIERILREYPSRQWPRGQTLYRLRVNPADPSSEKEYDSPPLSFLGNGRFDSVDFPVLYCSQDIEGCVHECRVTVEDDLFVATLKLERDIRLLDLTELLVEENVTEFESLDMAVHMLFYAGKHSYSIARAIARSAKAAGFDGLIYPSFFSQVRSGLMPFATSYGISVRRFPNAAEYAKSGVFPNVVLFGTPLFERIVSVSCINRVVLHKVQYDIHFGPAQESDTVAIRRIRDEPNRE